MDRVCPQPALHHITTILKEQRSDIDEVLETIYDNINQHRADLNICIPELRNVLYGLLLEHLESIKLLAASIPMGEHGQEYDTMVKILQQEGDDLVDSVNAKMHLANNVLMDKEYKDEANKPEEQARAATDAKTKQEECAVAVSATSQPVRNHPPQSGSGGELPTVAPPNTAGVRVLAPTRKAASVRSESPVAQTRDKVSPISTNLKVKHISHVIIDTAEREREVYFSDTM